MGAGANLVKRGKIGDTAHAGDPARVGHGGADIVNQLLLYQLLAVPDAVKDFPDRNGGHGVLADQTEALLIFSRRRILHPEQTILLDALAKARGLDRRQAMVHVMQKVLVEAKSFAHGGKQLRGKIKILLRRPQLLFRPQALGRRLIGLPFAFCHPVGGLHPRNAALHADGLKAHLLVASVVIQHFVNGVARGVAVNHHPVTGCPAQQLIQRHPRRLRFNIPQGHIDGGDSRHGHRPAAPVGSLVEELPDIFDTLRIAADKLRAEVILQVRCDGQLATV